IAVERHRSVDVGDRDVNLTQRTECHPLTLAAPHTWPHQREGPLTQWRQGTFRRGRTAVRGRPPRGRARPLCLLPTRPERSATTNGRTPYWFLTESTALVAAVGPPGDARADHGPDSEHRHGGRIRGVVALGRPHQLDRAAGGDVGRDRLDEAGRLAGGGEQ